MSKAIIRGTPGRDSFRRIDAKSWFPASCTDTEEMSVV